MKYFAAFYFRVCSCHFNVYVNLSAVSLAERSSLLQWRLEHSQITNQNHYESAKIYQNNVCYYFDNQNNKLNGSAFLYAIGNASV